MQANSGNGDVVISGELVVGSSAVVDEDVAVMEGVQPGLGCVV